MEDIEKKKGKTPNEMKILAKERKTWKNKAKRNRRNFQNPTLEKTKE